MRPVALALVLLAAGCSGSIRHTTTARAADETLLISTAAERAIAAYPAKHLAGKQVWIDESFFAALDKNFVISCLREHVSEAGALLCAEEDGAEVVLEIRNGTLGINDPSWIVGIPTFPIGYSDIYLRIPELSIGYDPQKGWAKFQLWTYDGKTGDTLDLAEVWGHAQTGWFASIKPGLIETVKEATSDDEERTPAKEQEPAGPKEPAGD